MYKTSLTSTSTLLKKTENCHIDELIKFKGFIENNKSFFYKNFYYLKSRYLSYKKNDYLINKFEFKKLTSFFILKRYKDKLGLNYVILDHFGSEKLKSRHLSYLSSNQNKLIFLSKKKINKSKVKLLDYIYFKIGFIKKFSPKHKKIILTNKEIFLGDTDIFLTIGKN